MNVTCSEKVEPPKVVFGISKVSVPILISLKLVTSEKTDTTTITEESLIAWFYVITLRTGWDVEPCTKDQSVAGGKIHLLPISV